MVIPQRESKSMCRRYILSLLHCGQCSGIVHESSMGIDSLVSDWLRNSTAKQQNSLVMTS